MSVEQSQYEALLAECSHYLGAVNLLKRYRPYFERIPSIRRSEESIITMPLPLGRIRQRSPESAAFSSKGNHETLRLPCDLAILMCDPEWKIKTGIEILVFIHHPNEDFSDLLSRWRHTQIYLDRGYEWLLPPRYAHILSEGGEEVLPLFVVFQQTPERIKRGLQGASLPLVEIYRPLEDIEETDAQVSEETERLDLEESQPSEDEAGDRAP